MEGAKPRPTLTAEQLLDAIFEFSPTRMFVVDRDGRFEFAAAKAVIGKNSFDVYASNPAGVETLRQVLHGNLPEARWIEDIGGVAFELHVRPLHDGDGEVAGALGIATIITKQVQAERGLVDSEARIRRIVDSNMLSIMFWDETGLVVDANDALLQLLGYTRADLENGLISANHITPAAYEEIDKVARAEIAATGVCTPYEKELIHKSGSHVPVLAGAARFEREKRAGVGFMLDLSERKMREREREELHTKLLQVQKLESLGLLAGGIAHDFNNLLTAILGGAATALLTLPKESPARIDIDNVLLAARRAADLTRQMLAYSGKGHFEIKAVDLSAMVREIATLLETTISKKVQLRLELSEVPSVEVDVAQVQQIIMNLVINAADAIGDKAGTVLVTTGTQRIDAEYAVGLFAAEALEPGAYAYLEVHDTGIGMDEDTKGKIFDPFFTTKFTGRGLGLAAVLGIVRAHHGAIRVYSSPGRGSTFKVFFPATNKQPEAPKREPTGYRGQGLVLVVDDDAAVRGAARRMLTFFGFTVIEAENGREGVEVFRPRANEVVMVLLDMTMPVMGGEETFRELRAIRPDVPVLLTSGYNEIEATRRFTTKGLAGFLQKPFLPNDLMAKVSLILADHTDG